MIAHILLGTDFSTRSDRAQRRATMLAKQLSARLTLVHVVDDDQPDHLIRGQVAAARVTLEESARTIEAFDRVEAEAMVVTGDSYSGILEAADDAGADLIVLGPHRRQLRDVFVGTTAERAVARSRLPILMAASVPSAPYARALVALDLDESSRSVAELFPETGLVASGDIVAVHAFDAPARRMMQRAMSDSELIQDYVRDIGRLAYEDFSRFLGGTRLATARRLSVPLNGTPARTIRESAAHQDASLIVLGTSQRTGIERFFLGSVAQDVVGEAEQDVLVVPARA